ncbi:Alpha/beta hydrolase fold-1 [Aspergillus egyptiacus]|nr:Alpha/beta hydrolase fold-1 [Aspergillus egyptiacus]
MKSTRPTVVFVPGAWHTPSAYDLHLPLLHKTGYPTTYAYLASVGAAAPVTFEDDVSAVRKVVAALVELGREVILVSHSYGGGPATEAVKGLAKVDREAKNLSGGVVQLIYIAAIVPTKGASSMEAFGPFKPREEGGTWLGFKDLGNGFPFVANPEDCFYHDLSPDVARYHVSRLLSHYQPVGYSPLNYEAYKDVPAAYLYCEEDRALPIENQKAIVKMTGIQRTKSLKASHSPFLSDPEGVVGFIRETVEGRPGVCHIL